MSSLTKDEYIDELQIRSALLAAESDPNMSVFVDAALRTYSGKLPKVKWDTDNAVVSGQSLYDFPADAIRIVRLRTTEGLQPVNFSIEDQSSGNKIRIGNIERHSYEDLLKSDYYVDPLSGDQGSTVTVTTETIISSASLFGYSAFDIGYVELQTIPNISDSGLETLAFYIEYLALNKKSQEISLGAVDEGLDQASSITDSSADGSTTTVQFSKDPSKTWSDRAEAKLKEFDDRVNNIPYGTRG